ncbi:MAG: type III-A CRISPR-associated protein Cas10/Csm1 [Deltaproteobacteria bacterium]|nr:type III-A CRISPR-associated protein Cas10/Csm1 [Deltaproteobacteria bacterium]
MDATTLKVAIAAFFYDIGKFSDKDTLGVSEDYINNNAGLYLPFFNGRHSHHHAVYTAAFIEQMKDFLPREFNSPEWGEDDSFINLAAGHHKPETPMQQIITMADWLTSGIDRDKFDEMRSEKIPVKDYKKTRLLPLFEQLRKPGMDTLEKFSYAYPLKPLSPLDIFPEKKGRAMHDDEKNEYRTLYDGFANDLKMLRHKDGNIALWFEHFESLFMAYASLIPAARVGTVVPDVSLYDHCRVTSAFAAALYLYHRATDSLSVESIKNSADKRFSLVSGNFYGIQNFIFSGYGDSRKYRSKLLRGRSFHVSLLSELSADMLCREIGLPGISVILNAAGKFTVLAPNTPKAQSAIEKVKKAVNDWLMHISFGEITIGFSQVNASNEDFSPEKFMELWEVMGQASEANKFSKFDLEQHGGVVKGYLGKFNNQLDHPMCPLCGKRPALMETENTLSSDQTGPVCRLCRDHVFMGAQLVKMDRIVITSVETEIGNRKNLLMEPAFGQYQILFQASDSKDMIDSNRIIKFWDISLYGKGPLVKDVSKKIISTYVPFYDQEDLEDERIFSTEKTDAKQLEMVDEIRLGDPKTLNHIAVKAVNDNGNGKLSGIDALGVLKADVDYLGMLMGCGLERQRFTISRLATLSRQFNYYFALYLPHMLMNKKRFKDIYTVFAGGDDLFLIGPWNRVYELSLVLEKTFGDYVCRNPAIRFSAGISLQKAHTPLNNLAESSESALEKSKSEGRDRFTMFYHTATWGNMKELEEVREKLETWLKDEWLTKSMLYRLNGFIGMAAMEEQVLNKDAVLKSDMHCLKWRALFYYSAKRNIGKKETKTEREKITDELIGYLTDWIEKYKGRLRIPLWNVLYNHR